MQIKQQMLAQLIQKKCAPLYILVGQDNYLLEDSLNRIKSFIKTTYDCDEQLISIQSSEDWRTVAEEANSYSLFSDTVFLNIVYDKKTIDAASKKAINEYINTPNPRCFMVIRAPNLPAKQLQWIANHEQVVVVMAYPLSSDAMKTWIINQLKKNELQFEQQIPELIHQYTQGNMLACAQVIEKIALSNNKKQIINSKCALEHLSDQCDHSLFELSDACLAGQGDKVIHIIRQAANNKTEPTLVLWMITQEIRILLQLSFLLQQRIDMRTACSQIKIWPQRIGLYQAMSERLDPKALQKMLTLASRVDEQIKSSFSSQVWNTLERLSLSLCLGHLIGEACEI